MTREETLTVVNKMLDESYKIAKERAEKLLAARDWDFDQFGDRNTFARVVFEVLMDNEISQYRAANGREKNQLEGKLRWEYCGL